MRINQLSLINFKRFKTLTVNLDASITILLGPNSSGKSSILKALAALKQTASPANENEPLASKGEYVDLGIYKDYIHKHITNQELTFSIDIPSSDVNFPRAIDIKNIRITISYRHDHTTLQARLSQIVVLEVANKQEIFSITKKVTRDSFIMKVNPTYGKEWINGMPDPDSILNSWSKGISLRVDDRFQMRPTSDFESSKPDFYLQSLPLFVARNCIESLLRNLDRGLFYIGPLRRNPMRSYDRTGHLNSVGPAGEHTASALANLSAKASQERSADKGHRSRLEQFHKWTDKLFPNRSADSTSSNELLKLVIGGKEGTYEAISDVGFGVSQALPILVQMAVMPDDSTLLVEQPELHLHPGAQTIFANIVAEASKSGRRFVIETHSEHLVRALQVAVSNKRANVGGTKLALGDVRFLYIPESPATPFELPLDEWGDFTVDWPKGFFDEGYRLAMILLRNKMTAQSKKAQETHKMRLAAHASAIKACFDGSADVISGPQLISANITVTAEILQAYHDLLGRNPSYNAWAMEMQRRGKFEAYSDLNAPLAIKSLAESLRPYGTASYYAGGAIAVSDNSFNAADSTVLSNLGIDQIKITPPSSGCFPGFNPIESIALQSGGQKNFDVLNKYIAAESIIYVYDRFINEQAMQLIEAIASNMQAGASLKIFTDPRKKPNCLSPSDISKRARFANANLAVQCHKVSIAFSKKAHDRYIFFGTRLQAVFTRGLDQFGPIQANGMRKNHLSTINIYHVESASALEIERDDGKKEIVRHYS